MNQVQQSDQVKPISYKRGSIQTGFLADGTNQGHLSRWLNPFLLIFMEKTLLFLFVAFGDFRNQVESFSSSWECPTLGQEQTGFVLFLFLSSI